MMADALEVLAGTRAWAVICGDAIDVLRELPTGSVDHVITDPPYEAEAHTKSRMSQRGPKRLRKTGAGFVPFEIAFAAMDPATRGVCGREFSRLVKRWSLVFCQLEGVRLWRDACEHYGMVHRRTCIWVKPDGAPQFTGDRPGTGYECIEAMHARGKSRWNGGGRRGVFVYPCNSQSRQPDEDHQTPKPLDLMAELVELFTDAGDVILDPFAGSGSTLIAGLRAGRRVIGCDTDRRWAEHCAAALDAESQGSTLRAARAGQLPLFGGG